MAIDNSVKGELTAKRYTTVGQKLAFQADLIGSTGRSFVEGMRDAKKLISFKLDGLEGVQNFSARGSTKAMATLLKHCGPKWDEVVLPTQTEAIEEQSKKEIPSNLSESLVAEEQVTETTIAIDESNKDQSPTFSSCVAKHVNEERLACYDENAGYLPPKEGVPKVLLEM